MKVEVLWYLLPAIFEILQLRTWFARLERISFKHTKMNGKLLTHVSNNFLSVFSPERSFMKCSPATHSSNLIIETDKVICMDIGVYVFYICLYVCIFI